MTTLVGRDRNCIGIFLDGSTHYIQHATVMAQVNHLATLRLDQAAHDIDGSIMTIEQGSCRHKPQRCIDCW